MPGRRCSRDLHYGYDGQKVRHLRIFAFCPRKESPLLVLMVPSRKLTSHALLATRRDDNCARLFGSIPGVEFTVYDDNPSVVCGCQSGPLPFYEPGLEELLASLRGKNLSFTSSLEETVSKSQIIFVCINTPLKQSGTGAGKAPDLSG
jgi:hypothetical protein